MRRYVDHRCKPERKRDFGSGRRSPAALPRHAPTRQVPSYLRSIYRMMYQNPVGRKLIKVTHSNTRIGGCRRGKSASAGISRLNRFVPWHPSRCVSLAVARHDVSVASRHGPSRCEDGRSAECGTDREVHRDIRSRRAGGGAQCQRPRSETEERGWHSPCVACSRTDHFICSLVLLSLSRTRWTRISPSTTSSAGV